MAYTQTIGRRRYSFADLRTLLARATPARSGDELAGVAARSSEERAAAQMALADLPLSTFLNEALVPYEDDEVTRLIVDSHESAAIAPTHEESTEAQVEEPASAPAIVGSRKTKRRLGPPRDAQSRPS